MKSTHRLAQRHGILNTVARLKRRLMIAAVVAVLYADFLAVVRWRTREIEYIVCGPGDYCAAPAVKRRDAPPSDWVTLVAYTAGNVAVGVGLWWLRTLWRSGQRLSQT